MKTFGCSRAELLFRLWASVAGLALLVGAVLLRGLPGSAAMTEVILIAAAFFGGTLLLSLRALRRGDGEDS